MKTESEITKLIADWEKEKQKASAKDDMETVNTALIAISTLKWVLSTSQDSTKGVPTK